MHNVFVAIPFMLLSRKAPTEMHKENLNSIPLQSIKSGARPQILKCHKKFFKEKDRPIEARYIDNQNSNAAPSTSVGAPSFNCTNRDNRTRPQGPTSPIAVSQTESPYKCEICGKGFSTVGNRKTHQKIGCEGILDYQCTFCNKKFGLKNNMEIHIKAMHTHRGSQDYQCSFCDQKYSLQASVKRHMKKKHKEILANELPSAIL